MLAPRVAGLSGAAHLQASPRNKIGVTYDTQSNCFCPTNVGPGVFGGISTPEAGNDQRFPLQRYVQVDWNSPISSKLLLEASGDSPRRAVGRHAPADRRRGLAPTDPRMIAVTDQATSAELPRRDPEFNNSWNVNLHYRAAISYITGSHAVKVGFNNAWGHHENLTYASNPISYTFFNGVPSADRRSARRRTTSRWTSIATWGSSRRTSGPTIAGRVAYGLRYDHFKNSFPEQTLEPARSRPNRSVTYPKRRQPELARHHAEELA